ALLLAELEERLGVLRAALARGRVEDRNRVRQRDTFRLGHGTYDRFLTEEDRANEAVLEQRPHRANRPRVFAFGEDDFLVQRTGAGVEVREAHGLWVRSVAEGLPR